MLDKLLGQVDEVTGQRNSGAEGRYAEISEDDFQNTFGSDLQAGVWRDLAEFVVDAQNKYNVGYGSAGVPSTVGRWYMALYDPTADAGAGAYVTGHARIKSRNSNDEGVETEVRSVHTRRLDTDPNTPSEQFAVPEIERTATVGEDSKVVLQFKLSEDSVGTAVDFAAAETVVAIPLTNFS